jgi:pyruvate kinase
LPAQRAESKDRRRKRCAVDRVQKRTKIVATVGPASRDPAMIRALLESGVNVLRLNFSHGTPQEHGEVIEAARRVAKDLGTFIAILQDLPGPKIRTGPLADGLASVRLTTGQTFTLTARGVTGTKESVSVSYRELPEDVVVGKRIYLQDGQIALRIARKTTTDIVTTVESGGDLRPVQGINYPDGSLKLAAVTDRDLEYLAFGLEHDVDYVAISFVRNADEVRRAKAFISGRCKDARVLAKIEKHEALDEIDEIVKEADGIMVARGDLGIEVALERIPMIQKDLIARCNRAGKPVVTATQMLESMLNSPRPTRAETTDVANAILDGSDAIMLSGETAIGKYPNEAVRVMTQIALEAEQQYPHGLLRQRYIDGQERSVASSIAEAATRSADELHLGWIVTGTTTGHTAHHIAAFRPRARIVALTPNERVARRLALLWGTEALLIQEYTSVDELLEITERRLKEVGYARSGDYVAFTTGMPLGAGRTNLLKLHQIP